MTKKDDRLKQALQETFGNDYEIIDGYVDSVDEENYLVDLRLDEDVVLFDVKLRAVSDGDKAGLVCLPAKGSAIVVAKIRGEADYVLLNTSALDKIIFEIDDVKLVASKSGFEIRKGNISLKDVFFALSSLLKQFKVQTPSGVSTVVVPDTLTAIEQMENKFNTLLNA